MRLPADTTEADGPNLTPVIDVVFLLLIFFLVATRYDQEERELDVNLPEVTEAQPLAMTQELIVNISRDGKYTIVRNEYTEQQLAALLEQTKEKNPHQSVLIRGDGESALRHAVRVMGLCHRAGLDCRIAALQEMPPP
jgi:biopolymer transport protein ExbD